ncbi:PAS domain S-box protein [Thermodesulfobacteriota bacterium]
MLVKKYLGKTLREMGFVTKQQLDEALEKQKQITREKTPKEGLQRTRLVTESRIPKETEMIPLLGQILTDMGFVSNEQLRQALNAQEKSFEDFMALENEKLAVAIEIGSLVNSTLNLAEVLYLIMKHANRVTNSVASTLMLLDEETGELVFSVPTGPKGNELIDIRIPPGEGVAGWVVKHEKPLLIPDVKADSRFYGEIDEISGFETKSLLCIPLMAKTKMIGALEVINKPDGTCFTEKDELLMSLFGYQAAVAIENARLCGELKAQLEKYKRTEQALRESEVKYSTVVENSKDGIVMISDRLLKFVNRASIELVGFPPEEMIGADFVNFVAPDYRDLVVQRYKNRMAGIDAPSIYEIELLRKDGETAPVELNAMRIDFENQPTDLVFIRDLAERKQTQVALRTSEDKYRTILESIENGYYEVDIAGNFTFFNDATCNILKYSRNELLGMNNREYMDKENAKKIYETFNRVYHTGISTKATDWKLIRKDGTECYVETGVSLLKDAAGRRVGFCGIARDVTERKKLEAQLHQAERMESLGTLAGGIAHDFNNLLMGVQGRTSLMKMDTESGHPHFEQLKGIEDYVKSAAELTNQLLGFARGGKYEVKTTDLNKVIVKQNKMFGRTRKEINIRGDYEKNLWSVEVDKGQIEQVLLNLYVNAWHAMPGGGDLHIKTENVSIDKNFVEPYQAAPGNYVKISVTDNGVGMDEATRRRIFEPFFTTKDMGRGSGLGLASSYGIIKNHAGFILVSSEKGSGTTFEIYLPASDKKAVEDRTVRKGILTGSETILLVDDEDMVIEVGQQILATLGYNVLTARGGKDAINVFEKQPDRIDLVVLDMIMPDVGGGDAYDKMKAVNPDVKVLLSSGYSVDGQATEILERGCDGFIQKPFNIEQLSKKIREILDGDLDAPFR